VRADVVTAAILSQGNLRCPAPMSEQASPPPETEPTLFDCAGGYPALLRLTKIFYGKHVPEDALLGPLFANMAPDHPERVAAWLGEVFGGPPAGHDR
jgi:hypothetical protein